MIKKSLAVLGSAGGTRSLPVLANFQRQSLSQSSVRGYSVSYQNRNFRRKYSNVIIMDSLQRSSTVNCPSLFFSTSPADTSKPQLPPRTVPEEKLKFKVRTYIGGDQGIQWPGTPHGIHPSEFKVVMKVQLEDLGLDERQQQRLKFMVGPRYNPDKDELTLVVNRFLNRIENKKYAVFLLENLLIEARKDDNDDDGFSILA